MKLSYIWILDFKGFYNEEFNFSSEFLYSYDQSKQVVTRNKNNKYIPNFFGEGITEVTGIVGKNATGKTNLLELIQYIVYGANTIINSSFLCIIENPQGALIYSLNIDDITNNFGAKVVKYKNQIEGFESVFFSNVFDGRNYNFSKKALNLSTNSLLRTQFGENVNRNYQNTIKEQIRFFNSNEIQLIKTLQTNDISEDFDNITPEQIVLTSPIWSNIRRRFTNFQKELSFRRNIEINLEDFIKDYRQKITISKSKKVFLYYTAFLVFVDVLLNREIYKFKETKVFHTREELDMKLEGLLLPLNSKTSLENLFDYWTGSFAEEINVFFELKRTANFLRELRDDPYWIEAQGERQDLGKYSNRKIQFKFEYDKKFGRLLNRYLDAVSNQNLVYTIDWLGMSSGHKAFVNLFSKFYSIRNKIDKDNVIITIDEGDLYFHPQWQREFLNSLLVVLPKILECNIQLFLTTHSPFLLSDLPKNNLIFLERNSIELNVIPNSEIDGETFGGNIGELYLDAFFMQGKLISEFAASKIQELIYKIKNERALSREDEILIESIGDEFIKIEIQNLRNGKN